jgi:UDP-N-acetyl-D-galactosamine dehydrogenase
MLHAMRETLCIVGLGYVGLPLAHAFAKCTKKKYDVCGFDINAKRIEELRQGIDRTNELTTKQLRSVKIEYGTDPSIIKKADFVIMAIPTPVDERNKPDLTPVEKATHTVGKYLKQGAIVVYESTVYPGVTEDICGKILAQESGLQCGKDFFLAYSPERINPGDKEHTVENIVKVVSGQDKQTLKKVAALYESILKYKPHRAPNIKVAEMAKAIENAQRDLNIAYINEIAMLCGKIGIATTDVLNAASTKWNFLRFQPGLVGGHCIGVDPYYLVEKAKMLGMETHVITAGRAVNDGMAQYVAEQVLAKLPQRGHGSRILILGATFKENIPDTRNSKVADVVSALQEAHATVFVHDAELSGEDLLHLGYSPVVLEKELKQHKGYYDAVLLLVAHKQYVEEMSPAQIAQLLKTRGVLFDLKSIFKRKTIEDAGKIYLAL